MKPYRCFPWLIPAGFFLACAGGESDLGPEALAAAPASPVSATVVEAKSAEPRRDGADWPRFLGPHRDGKSAETGIRKDWSDGLPILWQMEIVEGYSAPTTSEGRLFLLDHPGNEIRLRALDAFTGKLRWQSVYPTDYEDMYGYSNGPRTSPVVDGDRVYAFGPEGRLRCLDVANGEVRWEVDTAERYGVQKNFFGVGSTPAIHGDLLIAQVGGSPRDSPGIQSGEVKPDGSGIVAFHKKTGEEKYRLGETLASYASLQTAEIDGRNWAFALTRGGLLGFDPSSGKEDFFFPWRARKLESVNASTPVVVGDRVFITESYGPGGALLRVSPGKAEVIWQDPRRNQSLNSHWATPIHVDGVLYGCAGQSRGNAELRAVRLDDGEVLWSKPGLGRTTLLHVDDHLVVLGEAGELHLVKATPEAYEPVTSWTPVDKKGRPLLALPAWNGPILSHGVLYVRGKDRLLAVELIPPAGP